MPGSDRRLPGEGSGRVEDQGLRPLGSESSGRRLSDTLSKASSSLARTHYSACLQSPVHQGESTGRRSPQPDCQGSSRTSSPFSGFLQPPLRRTESFRSMEASDRPVILEPVCAENQVQDGNSAVGTCFDSPKRLDVFNRSSGCILPNSHSSGQQEVSKVLLSSGRIPVQGPVLRSFNCSSSLHSYDGSNMRNSS